MSRLSDPFTQPVLFSPVGPLDVTAVCILEAFQNQQSMLLADKVLKQLGKEKAKEKYKVNVQLFFQPTAHSQIGMLISPSALNKPPFFRTVNP